MNKMILMFVALASLKVVAAEQIQSLEGTGIDNQSCSVEISRDGDQLKSVSFKGAAQVFEILAERGSGYGPQREIRPRGGEEVIPEGADLFPYFQHSNNLFSDGGTFTLDTNDMPRTAESMGGLKMQISIELKYERGELVSVTATNKAKALLVATLASSKFTCEK